MQNEGNFSQAKRIFNKIFFERARKISLTLHSALLTLPLFLRLVSQLVDRVDRDECRGIGLFDEVHQLSVFAFIDDREYLAAGDSVVCADDVVKRRAAVEIVEQIIAEREAQ